MNFSQQSTEATIAKVLEILKAGGVDGSQVRKEVNTGTGLVAYNLEAPSKLLTPTFSPLRNRIPRVANVNGGTAVNWKVITALDIAKAAIFTAEGVKASKVAITVANKQAAFGTISLGDEVTFRAQNAGRSFEDVKARTITRLLKTGLVREEQGVIGGRVSALPAVTAPTTATATTGGTIAAATYNVYVRAVTHLPGSGITAKGRFSAATAQVTTGATSTLSATVPYVEGASRYEWYVGVGAAANCRLEATTHINSVALTALAGTGIDQAAVAAADTSNGADANAFNGIFAQLDGSANLTRTLATGTAGAGTQLTLAALDDLLQDMWDSYRVDPTELFVNSEESVTITKAILAASGAPTLYVTNDASEKAKITGGYRATHYLNPATGTAIHIETHPYFEQGTLAFGSFEMPFSASDIDNPVEIETLNEWMQLDYAPTRPAWDFEVLVDEVLKLYFPGSWGVIRNIAPRP